ncbi:RNA pol II accessory factor, Cdc73 family-domain-containing protein [Syncephalis plumigaleata]|nr:RNA pol II accessory factor, Cdc73 family-domain-containing protein [Syncephalis plumigaleata]
MDNLDPIPLLKQYATDKSKVHLVDGDGDVVQKLTDAQAIVFGELKIPKTQRTTFKKSGTEEEYYTVETLLLLIDHRDENYLAYLKAGISAEIPTVTVMDHGKLLGLLTASQDTTSANRLSLEAGTAAAAAGLRAENRARIEIDQGQVFSENDIAFAKAVMEREQVALSKDALICSNRSFDDIYKRVRDLLTNQAAGKGKPSTSNGTAGSSGRANGASGRSRPKGARIPIIIVPAAATSLINLYNVKQFLEDKSFVDSRASREQSVSRPTLVNIERRNENTDTTTIYQVIDSVDKLRPDDWKRVVAVFTTGAEWQFKNWVWQTPLEIFNNVKGYYLKYTDEQTKDTVQRWNVTILEVHKYKRHTDRVVVGEFWDALDAFIASKRPYLL